MHLHTAVASPSQLARRLLLSLFSSVCCQMNGASLIRSTAAFYMCFRIAKHQRRAQSAVELMRGGLLHPLLRDQAQ